MPLGIEATRQMERPNYHSANEKRIEGDPIMGMGITLFVFNVAVYRDSVLPALTEFRKTGDLNGIFRLLQNPPAAGVIREKEFRVAVEDFRFYSELLSPYLSAREANLHEQVKWGSSTRPLREIVEGNIAPFLVRLFCLARDHGIPIEADVSQRPLVDLLYQRSSWILEMFTMAVEPSGQPKGIPFGESTQILSSEELNRLFQELTSMPLPEDPSEKQQFVHLKSVVSAARDNKECAVGLVFL